VVFCMSGLSQVVSCYTLYLLTPVVIEYRFSATQPSAWRDETVLGVPRGTNTPP
jgi:hypothetical protein